MTLAEAKDSVGCVVFSRDPGTKMVRYGPWHGPWTLLQVTKGGTAIIKDCDGEIRHVPPSCLRLLLIRDRNDS